ATGNSVFGTTGLIFEGATADTFETLLTLTDPTADRTLTLPNVSGTVITTGDTGSVTGTMILDDTVALGTDTTGNYVSSATGSGGLVLTGTEGASLGVLLPAATDALSSTTASGSGLELLASGLALLQGCANNDVLAWNETADTWGCTSVGGVGAGDITYIGDVASGDAFTASGTQGTSLYFYDADGRGQLTIANLSAARTYTLPNATGTVITTGNLTDITATGTITSGTWNGTTIAVANGGTGATTLTSNGVLY
ncbi:MAG: hypothetical protein KA731_00005, partial [Candidatus Moranbacteria bacterium]|nr:hypothetical protein [Candidatus Moranbacteria bacterium]